MTRKHISFTFERWDISRDIFDYISPTWLQLCKSCSGLHNPWESVRFSAMISNNSSKILKDCYPNSALLPWSLSLWMPLALCFISLVFSALILILYMYLVQVLLRLSAIASCSYSSFASYYSIYVIGKLQINNISAAYNVQIWSVQSKCWRGWVTDDILSLLWLFWTIFPCCHSSGLHFKPCHRAATWCKLGLHWHCCSAWWPIRLHAMWQLCQRLFWNH